MSDKDTNTGASTCGQGSCEGCASSETCTRAAGGTNASSGTDASGRTGKGQPESMLEQLNVFSSIKKVIGVVSGKGGVGKSFVTASLASAMVKKGARVGIMDADITGPSIPKMYGIHEQAFGTEQGIIPIEAADGTKIMSINLLMDSEEAPVIWRGPVIAGVVKQFWTDVVWGELDYLFVDMPPGTGDVPLTVFQSLPIDGIIIVTSPQELVQLIVKKAYNMAEMMHIPIIGVIENYSYLKCPDCNKEIKIFGESNIEEEAAKLDIDVLAKLPLDPAHAQAADAGRFYQIENPFIDKAIEAIGRC